MTSDLCREKPLRRQKAGSDKYRAVILSAAAVILNAAKDLAPNARPDSSRSLPRAGRRAQNDVLLSSVADFCRDNYRDRRIGASRILHCQNDLRNLSRELASATESRGYR
jgi:hypothetical protein